jgi:hypothetical protein
MEQNRRLLGRRTAQRYVTRSSSSSRGFVEEDELLKSQSERMAHWTKAMWHHGGSETLPVCQWPLYPRYGEGRGLLPVQNSFGAMQTAAFRHQTYNSTPSYVQNRTYTNQPYHSYYSNNPNAGMIYPTPCLRDGQQKTETKHRKALHREGKHGREHVVYACGAYETSKMGDEEIKRQIEKLNGERKKVGKWAKNAVKRQMLASAQRVHLRVGEERAQKYSDIRKSWSKDGSEQNARKLYWVFFGDFEKQNAWSLRLEQEYMALNKIEYEAETEETRGTRGCYEQAITHAKATLVRGVNDATKKSHTKRILISRDNIPEEQKFRKRKGGTFYVKKYQAVCSWDKRGVQSASWHHPPSASHKPCCM